MRRSEGWSEQCFPAVVTEGGCETSGWNKPQTVWKRLGSPVITGYAVTDSVIMKASTDTHREAGLSREKHIYVVQNLSFAWRVPVKKKKDYIYIYFNLICDPNESSIGRFVKHISTFIASDFRILLLRTAERLLSRYCSCTPSEPRWSMCIYLIIWHS